MEQKKKSQQDDQCINLPRRNLLIGTGALAAGMMLTKVGGLLGTADAKIQTANWPWPYEKLDPARAGETAYHAWYEVFCSQAVTTGLFEQLREKVGEPWVSFPISSLRFGMGGMLGWGLTCGAPVAGALTIGLTVPAETANSMIHELLQWYSDTPMPVYVAQNPKFKGEIPRTVAKSPACHQSVGRWMKAANSAFGSDERRHRCAGVTASVAYRTAEMLNEWKDGKYISKAAWNGPAMAGLPAQQNCMSCHGNAIPTAPR